MISLLALPCCPAAREIDAQRVCHSRARPKVVLGLNYIDDEKPRIVLDMPCSVRYHSSVLNNVIIHAADGLSTALPHYRSAQNPWLNKVGRTEETCERLSLGKTVIPEEWVILGMCDSGFDPFRGDSAESATQPRVW
ncbi:hypothetical protein CALCODRAFT_513504 [Calocera cornea HHB12733]|uniref:Uncharacterized protein n=1 Tax=Calocera cornea HHB12733 TaxID=1353952 RepID=A0A165C1D7_9BASI|nr:hypothetical protein CALCODRAFT_513504 [Calocera cornea HHB12733]